MRAVRAVRALALDVERVLNHGVIRVYLVASERRKFDSGFNIP